MIKKSDQPGLKQFSTNNLYLKYIQEVVYIGVLISLLNVLILPTVGTVVFSVHTGTRHTLES